MTIILTSHNRNYKKKNEKSKIIYIIVKNAPTLTEHSPNWFKINFKSSRNQQKLSKISRLVVN